MTMQSRRDLFQAHRLMTQRAALALLRGEPDIPDQPLRRINVATFIGVLVAVIAVAGFGIWGLLFHSSPSLSYVAGTLIIDKQTGTDYVFCPTNHQRICPVANYASALLALQDPNPPNVESVNQSSLTGKPHGPEIGILGLPQDLPVPGNLVKQPWSVCTQTVAVGGVGPVTTTTVAGGIPTGGQPLGDDALLVTTQANGDWVIWHNKRYPIQGNTLSLEFPTSTAVGVPSTWLNPVQQGQPFVAPAIQGFGTPVAGPNGGRVNVGQLYTVNEAGTTEYFVMTTQGLAGINQLQDSLLSIQPGASAPLTLAASQLQGHQTAALPSFDLPTTKPQVSAGDQSAVQSGAPLCLEYSGPGPSFTTQVEVGGAMAQGGVSTPLSPTQIGDVALPPGKGALIQENGRNISYFLIFDGRSFALSSTEVVGFLGYSTSQAVQLPSGVVQLIPPGPGFNPSDATNTVTLSSGSQGSSG